MIEKELSERINNEVDKLFDDQIRFTQKLTRFPSLRGQEHTAQDFLFDELTKRNYALDRWTVNVEDIKDHPGFSPGQGRLFKCNKYSCYPQAQKRERQIFNT